MVITDVGHKFDIKIQNALAEQNRLNKRHVSTLAYYDNPEPYVPGGYSDVAAAVMRAAEGVLFANSHLAKASLFQEEGKEIDFGTRKKVGLGYYPIDRAEKMGERRATEQLSLRKALFIKQGLTDTGQEVLVYFGGNNNKYFNEALPAFLSFLEEGKKHADLSQLVIVFQQHPGAARENLDKMALSTWMSRYRQEKHLPTIILSDFSSDEAQILANGALYYQTSMGPQFILAGIPAIQVGHKTYEDILVKNKLSSSATTAEQFMSAINDLSPQKKEIPKEVIFEKLGIKSDWLQVLEKAIDAGE